jgi:flavin-binding protein dodecin
MTDTLFASDSINMIHWFEAMNQRTVIIMNVSSTEIQMKIAQFFSNTWICLLNSILVLS